MKKIPFVLITSLLVSVSSCSKVEMENDTSYMNIYSEEKKAVLGRGLVSCPSDRGYTTLSWRLLPEDEEGVAFNVYRKKIGDKGETLKFVGQTELTSYTDRLGSEAKYAYAIRAVHGEWNGNLSRESIPLEKIGKNKGALVLDIGEPYRQLRVVTGDLNGDGEPEVVASYSNESGTDPDVAGGAWHKSEDTIKVAAFLPTGMPLWRMDLGRGIEAGINYQPMVVWDLDGDGRAEVILKTNKSGDPLDYSGDRITILDGTSGEIKGEAKWPSLKGLWSDYNNDSRNYLAIAHLDGKEPYIIAARGCYRTQKIWALDKNLRRVWQRTIGLDHHYPSGFKERLVKLWNRDEKVKWLWARFTKRQKTDEYRGSHSLPVVDINDDGKEEILWGERCIGENGKDLWAIEENIPYKGHADVVFPADILPSHKGKEIFYCREGWGEKKDKIGVLLADQGGNVLWAHWGYNHVDKGWAGKIMVDNEGMQLFGFDIGDKDWSASSVEFIDPKGLLWNAAGKSLGNVPVSWSYSFLVDWDGDGTREICIPQLGELQNSDGRVVEKLPGYGIWGGDIFGDHREEIVAASGDGKIYIIFSTAVPEGPPRVTPMADRQYKNDLSRMAMQLSPIPTEGGYIPGNMKK